MAQNIDEIAEILNNMREENERNTEGFEKILTGINNKLEMMADDSEASDLLRLYISELKRAVEEKHISSMERFEVLESSLENLANKDFAQTSQINELSDSVNLSHKESLEKISQIKDEFRQAAESDLENYSRIVGGICEIDSKVSDMEQIFAENSQLNFDNLKTSLDNLSDRLSLDLQEYREAFESQNGECFAALKALSDDIKSVEIAVQEICDSFNNEVQTSSSDIKGYLSQLSNSVSSSQSDIEAKLAAKLDSLSGLSSNIEASVVSVNEGVQNVLDIIGLLDFSEQNNDLKAEIEKISSSVSVVLEALNLLNVRNEKLDAVVGEIFENLKNKDDINNLNSKMDEYSNAVNSLKELVMSSFAGNSQEVNILFGNIENAISNVVTQDDFSGFKQEFAQFLQQVLDNASILNSDSEFNREKLSLIADKIDSIKQIDYSTALEGINNKIDELKILFENDRGILNEILELKEDINLTLKESQDIYNTNFVSVDAKLSDLASDVQSLRDFTAAKPDQIIDDVSSRLNIVISETLNVMNSDNKLNFGHLKDEISEIKNRVNLLSEDFVRCNDANVFNISNSFDSLKISLENIISALNDFSESTKNNTQQENVILNLTDISNKIDELKFEIDAVSSGYVEKISNCVEEISLKLDSANNDISGEIEEKFNSLKASVSLLLNDFQNNEYFQKLKENDELQTACLQRVSDNIDGFREHVDELVYGIKDYIAELDSAYNSSLESTQVKLSENLINLETALVNSSQEYEQKSGLLQAKLAEFAHIIENKTSVTDEKIEKTVEQYCNIQDQLVQLNESLKAVKISSDEGLSEAVLKIDTQIENIVLGINGITSAVAGGVEDSLKNSMLSIDEKFHSLTEFTDEVKDVFMSSKEVLLDGVNDKLNEIKDDFSNINTDLLNAIHCKSDEIISAVSDIRNGFEEITGLDYEKVISEIKSQLELSFMNFSVDMNSEFAEKSEILTRLEQAYKETYNRVEAIEVFVSENVKNNVEFLNSVIEQNSKKLYDAIDNRIQERINELKAGLQSLLKDSDTIDTIDVLKEEFSIKFDNLINEQKTLVENNNVIAARIDAIAEDTSSEEILSALDILDSKFEKHNNKLDSLSQTDDKVVEMLSVLNTKVDVLASEGADYDLGEELEDIKDLIFEQRKYFEASSDEKTAAIDKYLRDVLLKLDNVDLEKSAEDIKDSILNALLSLVEQISFVEESEDIKDFVEEKTDEINKNLIAVQNQLKQIASSDDDFEYSYTLQDVESDIAKLRLDISHMSGSDFAGISDDIKKIVKAVNGLESSLTQDEVIGLKGDIEKINEDILSISSRTNKLLLFSDESHKALNEGLDNFSSIICKLEDRINYLDNTQASERLERKVDNIYSLAAEAANSNKVFHQAMIYVGEWIDSTTENISSITDKTSQISTIKDEINELKEIIPHKTELINKLENEFEQQQNRIDRLEMKIEKILSTLEQKDDMMLNRKVENIEKLISNLNANIEKLASYVDEE